MSNMLYLEYLGYSSLIIAIVSGFYWLFLRKETFYRWNRWVLLGGLMIALSYPLLPVPNSLLNVKSELKQLILPVQSNAKSQALVGDNSSKKMEQSNGVIEPASTGQAVSLDWYLIFLGIYCIGVGILTFRFGVQLWGVFSQLRGVEISRGKAYHLVSLKTETAPFSFGKYIFLNPDKYTEKEFFQILNHEKIHVRQGHTIDLILAELLTVFQWFNPMAWLYRYLTVENLEFQVDEKILASGEDKKNYQYHLLKIAIPNYPLSITTNYNQSLIKKRITMMNRKKSSLGVVSKYALLLPILFFVLVAFKEASPVDYKTEIIPPESNATERNEPESSRSIAGKGIFCVITASISSQELREIEDKLETKGVEFYVSNKNFNDGLLTEISFNWKGTPGHNGNGSYTFSHPSDKVYFYIGKSADGSFRSGTGSRCKDAVVEAHGRPMPRKVLRAIEDTQTGYLIGEF